MTDAARCILHDTDWAKVFAFVCAFVGLGLFVAGEPERGRELLALGLGILIPSRATAAKAAP